MLRVGVERLKVVEKKNTILVTGSSGYVASELIPLLSNSFFVFGVDKCPSMLTNTLIDISSSNFRSLVNQMPSEGVSIINLAAARFDFGAKAKDYYWLNVECHKNFLKSLNGLRVTKFIHVSSVAALDGRNISYSDDLNCDDAYRATKYLQEVVIKKWCDMNNVELIILYPSAIFSNDPRSNTNIGKLQSISKYIPFIPKINVIKSLTYLPTFSEFIVDLVAGEISTGNYLTIEKPSLTVSKMIQLLSGRSIKLVNIPFLSIILQILANLLHILGCFGRIDLKLTPNRVVKLFSDTSYSIVKCEGIDTETYTARNREQLSEILAQYNKEKVNE